MAQARSWFSRKGRLKKTVVPKLTAVWILSNSMPLSLSTERTIPLSDCVLGDFGALPMLQRMPLGFAQFFPTKYFLLVLFGCQSPLRAPSFKSLIFCSAAIIEPFQHRLPVWA